MAIDFSGRYKDYAKFLPAISEMYVRLVEAKTTKRPSPVNLDDLDFLDKNSNLFHIPYALYSAGQATKDRQTSMYRQDMVNSKKNDPNIVIVGDSGGFQIQQGSYKWKGDATRKKILEWLEATCDNSMVLDFPTGGINLGSISPHTERLKAEGVDVEQYCRDLGLDPSNFQHLGFATCLKQTLINNDYFVANRTKGKTNFLNVLQGRSEHESALWYQNVKQYPFEGWAFGGKAKEKMDILLNRFLDMRDDGLLEHAKWVHILGVGKLENGCLYSTMQREIRRHYNPDFSISYDVSSPFTTTAYGNVYLGYCLNSDLWGIHTGRMAGRHYLKSYDKNLTPAFKKNFRNSGYIYDENGNRIILENESSRPFLDLTKELLTNISHERPEFTDNKKIKIHDYQGSVHVDTEIGKLVTMGDLAVNDDPKFTATWDLISYAILMNHNLQIHIEAVLEANELYDKGDVMRVPQEMLILKDLIQEILDPNTKNPREIIEKRRAELRYYSMGELNELADEVVVSDFDLTSQGDYRKSYGEFKKVTAIPEKNLVPTTDSVFSFQ